MTARAILLAVLGALALAAPASASEVLHVEGGRTVAVDDPTLPPRAATDLPAPPPGTPRALGPRARSAAARGPSVTAVLRRALARRAISRDQHDAYRALYREARATLRGVAGARRANLRRVVATLERVAREGELTTTRMPALFLILRRNAEYWPAQPIPAAGARVTFAGSPLVFQHYPGHGLQLQPLGNFGKANAIYNACRANERSSRCDKPAMRELLDWMLAVASRRGRSTAWEYFFAFGGGSPPWTSGLSQGTGVQALARATALLGDPAYARAARVGLGVFRTGPPTGVRKRARGGAHYLIYSFNPRLEVLNGFLQAVIGLHDYARITGDPLGQRLFAAGDRVARRQIPLYDTGDWSLYSRRGERADVGYHRLVAGFLRGLCERTGHPTYCAYADRFEGYLARPPRRVGRERVHADEPAPVTSSDPNRWTISVRVAGGRRTLVFARGG